MKLKPNSNQISMHGFHLLPARPACACGRRLFMVIIMMGLALGSGCRQRGGTLAPYETVAAAHGELVENVTASGTLSAVVSVEVGSQVSGKISALYADF